MWCCVCVCLVCVCVCRHISGMTTTSGCHPRQPLPGSEAAPEESTSKHSSTAIWPVKTMGSKSGVKVIDTVRSTTGRELRKTAKRPMRRAQILPHSTSPTCRGALSPQDILTGGKEARLCSHGEATFSPVARAPVYPALRKLPHLCSPASSREQASKWSTNSPHLPSPSLPPPQAPVSVNGAVTTHKA